MRCKKHLSDLSSTVGVCATCLRERLKAHIAAQAQAQLTRIISRASEECSRNSDPNPPPLNFPRSVSPYISGRKSDYDAACHGCHRREQLFFSTPQVGPNFDREAAANGGERRRKKRWSKFWIFSNLFKSRSEKFQSDPSCEKSSPASPSFFSTFFPDRRKNRGRFGMSPARADNFADEWNQFHSGSGCSSESSPRRRGTPSSGANSARRSRLGFGKSVSDSAGMAFCLSPLVRWNHKGLPPEMMAAASKPHLSAAASFCANRSRKLADFGKVNRNR